MAAAPPEMPFELELYPLAATGPRGWEVGGDYPSLTEAEAALLDRLSVSDLYARARVRQYGPSRATAQCFRTWEIEAGQITRTIKGGGTTPSLAPRRRRSR